MLIQYIIEVVYAWLCAFIVFGNEGILNSASFFKDLSFWITWKILKKEPDMVGKRKLSLEHAYKHDVTCYCNILVNWLEKITWATGNEGIILHVYSLILSKRIDRQPTTVMLQLGLSWKFTNDIWKSLYIS